MIFNHIMTGIEVEDFEFDETVYPESINNIISATHFTPVEIAKKAAYFLAPKPGTKVLDIGSGAGKFCMVGAAITDGHFTGVEHRESLHQLALDISTKRQFPNIEFIHANITEIDFSQYQSFYFYNSFFENIMSLDRIDDTVEVQNHLYEIYSNFVKKQLDKLPIGTRLATYFSSYDEVPKSYKVLQRNVMKKLTFWEKVA